MTPEQIDDLEANCGLLIAHTSLLTTMLGVLQGKGLISQETVNEIIDLALVGVETAVQERPKTFKIARKVLEEFGQTMGGKRR